MFNLKQSLEAISTKWKFKMKETSTGVFQIDVAIKIAEDKWRYQKVDVWRMEERCFGDPGIFLNSKCGQANSKTDMRELLKESGESCLTTITVVDHINADGVPVEIVVCQAAIPEDIITETILDKVLYEVGFNADLVEEEYFGEDEN